MGSHVGAGFVSLAPTFFKSQSALAPLLLLSKPDPLPLGSGLVFGECHKSCIATRTASEQNPFAPAYFYACGFKISLPPAPLLLLCAKGHARLACSVASVLATARCRYQPFAGSSPTLKDGMAYLLPPIYASEQNPFAPAYFYLRKMHIFRPRLCSAPLILKFFFNHIRSTNTVAILDNMDYFVLLFYSKDVWWCALCQ